MYFLDPRQGARRRSLFRDACVRLCNETRHAADVATRDLSNRLQGLQAEVTSYFRGSAEPAGDDQLIARIRTQLGRVCSHPRALEVEAHNGRITLRGPVLAAEAQRVFDCVRHVRGVEHVENQMEQHQTAGNISALQGGATRPGAQRWDLMQERWSPATRLLVGAGAASLLACASGRGLLAGTLGAVGLGMITGNTPGRLASPNRGMQQRRQPSRPRTNGGRRPAQRMTTGGMFDREEYEFGEERSSMKVANIMTPSPATCHRDTKLQEAARLMLSCDCGAIPVVDQGTNQPVGVITDRDITVRALGAGRNPLEMKVSDCMSSPVETISSEAGLEECLDKMEMSQIRRMIVVDADDKIVGIVAQADVALYAPEEETAELVHDVSTPTPAPTI
jgi:CBS domain-containing protein